MALARGPSRASIKLPTMNRSIDIASGLGAGPYTSHIDANIIIIKPVSDMLHGFTPVFARVRAMVLMYFSMFLLNLFSI